MKIRISLILIITSLMKIISLEAVLIAFNNLKDTTIDFSRFAQHKGYSEEVLKEMKQDLDPSMWKIHVNSSSWTKEARERTYLLTVANSQTYPDQIVLGVRAYFPQRYANSYVTIRPPFEIPSYYDNPENPNGQGEMFLNKGVVRNVGVLRKLSVNALGNNFRYSLYVRIKDHLGLEKDVFVGYMDYQGWKSKAWINPNIEYELSMRETRKKTMPNYPDEFPFVKLLAFVILRDSSEITGNFVTMIKDVTVEYDEAIIQTGKTEDKQEEIFGIYTEELLKRANSEMQKVDNRIYLEWEERKKQHKDEDTQKRTNRATPTKPQEPAQN